MHRCAHSCVNHSSEVGIHTHTIAGSAMVLSIPVTVRFLQQLVFVSLRVLIAVMVTVIHLHDTALYREVAACDFHSALVS